MKKKLDTFMEELRQVFDKYMEEGVPLNMLVNSADLLVDTIKKELKE